MVWTSAKKHINCFLLLCLSVITKVCYIKTHPKVKFSLYQKKAGLASRNIVYTFKKIVLRCVGFCFKFFVKERSLRDNCTSLLVFFYSFSITFFLLFQLTSGLVALHSDFSPCLPSSDFSCLFDPQIILLGEYQVSYTNFHLHSYHPNNNNNKTNMPCSNFTVVDYGIYICYNDVNWKYMKKYRTYNNLQLQKWNQANKKR